VIKVVCRYKYVIVFQTRTLHTVNKKHGETTNNRRQPIKTCELKNMSCGMSKRLVAKCESKRASVHVLQSSLEFLFFSSFRKNLWICLSRFHPDLFRPLVIQGIFFGVGWFLFRGDCIKVVVAGNVLLVKVVGCGK